MFLYYAALVEKGGESSSMSPFPPAHHLTLRSLSHILSSGKKVLTTITCCSQFDLCKDIQSLFSNLKFSAKLFYIYMRYFKPRTSVGASQIFRTFKLDSISLFRPMTKQEVFGRGEVHRIECIRHWRGGNMQKVAIFRVKLY